MASDPTFNDEMHLNGLIGRYLTDEFEAAVIQSLEREHPATLAHLLRYFVEELTRMSTHDGRGDTEVLYDADGLDLQAMRRQNRLAYGEALQVAVIRLSWRLPTLYQAYCETVDSVFRRLTVRRRA